MRNYNLNHLQQLESEAIFVLRETAAQFERPGLLFSGGKDSIIMAYLASKYFATEKITLPFVMLIQDIISQRLSSSGINLSKNMELTLL